MTWSSSEQQPVVVRDRFPVEVTAWPDEYGPRPKLARVVLTRERLYVFVTTDGPVLDLAVESHRLRGSFDATSTPERADTTLGTVEWRAAGGCGCSHPLKHFRPFAGARRLAAYS